MKSFHGIFPFLVTPLKEDGSINESVLRNLINHLIAKGVHGLTPLGSTGEIAYLDLQQRRKVVETVVDEVGGRVPVVTGVGSTSTREAVEQAKEAEKIGVDGILSILPTYFPISNKGLFEYFGEIAGTVSCPVVLYTNPKVSKAVPSPELVNELAHIENVSYFKDASGDLGRLLNIIRKTKGKLKIFSASASIPLFVMMLGGVGWMSGPACLIPEECVELYELCQDGKWDKAMSIQLKIWKLQQDFQRFSLAPCIKAGLQIQGFEVGKPVHPLKELNSEDRKQIHRTLKNL